MWNYLYLVIFFRKLSLFLPWLLMCLDFSTSYIFISYIFFKNYPFQLISQIYLGILLFPLKLRVFLHNHFLFHECVFSHFFLDYIT